MLAHGVYKRHKTIQFATFDIFRLRVGMATMKKYPKTYSTIWGVPPSVCSEDFREEDCSQATPLTKNSSNRTVNYVNSNFMARMMCAHDLCGPFDTSMMMR